MPKKTKKEKVLAMYRKKLRLLENVEVPTSSVQIKTAVSIPAPTLIKDESVISEPVGRYFFSDLKKSLLLTIIILGILVSLYFANLIK